MSAPPQVAIAAALAESVKSPCAKSKRGVSAYRRFPWPHVVARGHNAQPPGFACDGSDACRAACNKLCVHAEQAVLAREFDGPRWEAQVYLVHVKSIDGVLVPSGPPSCDRCSCLIAADSRVHGVWLYHADGWRLYESAEFHELTLRANGLPVLRGAL